MNITAMTNDWLTRERKQVKAPATEKQKTSHEKKMWARKLRVHHSYKEIAEIMNTPLGNVFYYLRG